MPEDAQMVFSMPYNGVIESFYASLVNTAAVTTPTGINATLVVQIYTAAGDSASFDALPNARLEYAFSGTRPANTVTPLASPAMNVPINAGRRVFIGVTLESTGTGTLDFSLDVAFSGGVCISNP
jgi:hypothetical protein